MVNGGELPSSGRFCRRPCRSRGCGNCVCSVCVDGLQPVPVDRPPDSWGSRKWRVRCNGAMNAVTALGAVPAALIRRALIRPRRRSATVNASTCTYPAASAVRSRASGPDYWPVSATAMSNPPRRRSRRRRLRRLLRACPTWLAWTVTVAGSCPTTTLGACPTRLFRRWVR